ncbi:hypothetical protein K439DRAFT_1652322 [Ramaria rubella]|nr:hypothetical protein K439DRAFT_1652322 [Ramaria rubella]
MAAIASPMSPLASFAFAPEPDLHPLYPTATYVDPLLSPNSGLSPPQKHDLVQHSLSRACTFADLALLAYLLADPNPRSYVDLAIQDEDGLGLISTTILGFGGESERDVEREECVRLLVSEGADVTTPDKAGWTALHHAGLLSPPTLVSFLLTHGSSPLTLTRRGLTPLDILTAHSLIPGRESVALLLEEAMRESGWSGGRMELRRRREDERTRRQDKRLAVKRHIGHVLGLNDHWWGDDRDDEDESEEEADADDDQDADGPLDMSYSPPPTFTTMLVFSPTTLSDILDSLTYTVRPTLRCSEPARAIYLLARFACLTCDDTWLEDLMGGAVDRIERIVFAKADDVALQSFWLFNTTALLHFLRCDANVAEICDLLDLFSLLEGVIRAIYVFIIRTAERKMDPLLDTTLLEHAPLSSEFDSLHFEGEWSFLRPFASSGTKLTKKKPASASGSTPPAQTLAPSSASLNGSPRPISTPTSRPPSPSPSLQNVPVSPNPRFPWTQGLSRTRASSLAPSPASITRDTLGPNPHDVTTLLEALHTLLSLAGINPALITQIYSQVMYWTACEMFNRILTRKKYLCRSRAVQIGMNLSVLEEWVVNSGLPHGVESHFAPVRELLVWLQCSSSVDEFTTLVETIQTMKHLNPLQMRRAVRDYRYEVSETRMSEECAQYLVQLQKDWERRRVKLGVEALRREMHDRERERDGSVSSTFNDESSRAPSISTTSTEKSDAQRGIDLLFSRAYERAEWSAPSPPEALGELRDSRYMLPLVLPSDPRFLAAVPSESESSTPATGRSKRESASAVQTPVPVSLGNGAGRSVGFALQQEERSASRASVGAKGRGAMRWRSRSRKLRRIGIETLEWVDGVRGLGRWSGGVDARMFEGEESESEGTTGQAGEGERREEGEKQVEWGRWTNGRRGDVDAKAAQVVVIETDS